MSFVAAVAPPLVALFFRRFFSIFLLIYLLLSFVLASTAWCSVRL
jgi:hypothetical protein